MTDTDPTLRDEVAEVLRWVPIGPFGPNARETINVGGTTFLSGSEREAFADALMPLLARVREEANPCAAGCALMAEALGDDAPIDFTGVYDGEDA